METLKSTNISLFKSKERIRSKGSHTYTFDLALVKKLGQLDFNKTLKEHKQRESHVKPFYKGYIINNSIPSIETYMSKIEFGCHINNITPLVFKTLFDNSEKELNILTEIKEISNTVRIVDYFVYDDKKVLVFKKLMKIDIKKLDLVQIVRYVNQLLNTLVEFGKIGLVHMDITPSNLMLDSKDEITLIDFGLAKFCNLEPIEACGTPGYIAPELLNNSEIYPEKLDIYSLGCIFGIMLQDYIPNCNLNLLGCSLFKQRDLEQIIDKLEDFLYSKNSLYSNIVFEAAHMLLSMLNPDPLIRLDAKKLLNCSFVSTISNENSLLNIE